MTGLAQPQQRRHHRECHRAARQRRGGERAGLGQQGYQSAERHQQQAGAYAVERAGARGVGALGAGERPHAQQQRRRQQHDVDREDGTPAGQAGERATEGGAGRRCHGGGGTHQAEGAPAPPLDHQEA